MAAASNDEEDVFTHTLNPYAKEEQKTKGMKQPAVPKERKYALPDPSKKKVVSQDTPIRVNPSGQYNLNFIDWNNEWEAVMDRDPASYESPIQGMDSATFEAIFDEEMFDTVKK